MRNLNCRQCASIGAALFGVIALVLIGAQKLPEKPSVRVSASPACADIQPNLSLIAVAAYAEDLKTGKILYEKNADTQLPFASLTKLMTVATALSTLAPNDTITITKEALAPEGDAGFVVGEKWKTSDLIAYTLLVSANDGAHALALAAAAKKGETFDTFLQEMNAKAKELGMDESFFANDTGLDMSSTTAGAYGSAHDIALLLTSLVKTSPNLIEGTQDESKTFTSLNGRVHKATNTSNVISTLPGAVASKTGYTDLAGGNLVIIFEPIPGRPVAAVVLGSTRDGRNTDMQTLAEGAKKALKHMLLCTDDGS